MDIEKALIEYWRDNSLTDIGATVVVACSGGPDSLALLDILDHQKEALHIRLVAAHYEHGIRGKTSRADADFVRQYCDERKIPFFMEFGDIPSVIKATGESL